MGRLSRELEEECVRIAMMATGFTELNGEDRAADKEKVDRFCEAFFGLREDEERYRFNKKRKHLGEKSTESGTYNGKDRALDTFLALFSFFVGYFVALLCSALKF